MIKYLTVFALLSTSAYAQIKLDVTQDELNIISEGLQTQPFGKVVPIINKLRAQIQDQQPKPVIEPPKEAPK